MNKIWFQTVTPIALLFSFRMLGLFMLIPVLSIHANHLIGATPILVGFSLGVYGLTQGLLQLPFGILSDKYGRKPLIIVGLLCFVLGSIIGAVAHNIYVLIFARALQGMGAIGSVLLALLADLTSEKIRTLSMAIIGSVIGISFAIAMVISPLLTQRFGFQSIFWVSACLGLLGLMLITFIIPQAQLITSRIPPISGMKQLILNQHLQKLNISIFSQHYILTAFFFSLPIILDTYLKQNTHFSLSTFYLEVMFLSFIVMIPAIIWTEKKQKTKLVFIMAVIFIVLSQILLIVLNHQVSIVMLMTLIYFIAFNILEAQIPSLVTRQVDPRQKGLATGIYSSSQFLGIFLGGCGSGIAYSLFGHTGIFIMNGLIATIWLICVIHMKPNIQSVYFNLTSQKQGHFALNAIKNIPGVVKLLLSRNQLQVRVDINRQVNTVNMNEMIHSIQEKINQLPE